eukprot:scaffold1028_cov157-Skeletonema_menzelii.AAC.16
MLDVSSLVRVVKDSTIYLFPLEASFSLGSNPSQSELFVSFAQQCHCPTMFNRALLSLVLLLSFQNCNGKLDCPAPVELGNTANESSYDTEGPYDKYLNAFNGSLIERIRSKKTESFYKNVVDNVVMFLCDVEIASERCVPSDSPLAAKNSEGDCVVAADSLCPQGLCERTSNCY